MKERYERDVVCPLCGKHYIGRPALSRIDNKTYICPECGTRQALASIGVDEREQEEIIATIYSHGAALDSE
ncbi:MAG: hypothetical protein IJJ01_05850 [Firmicutes bacterium]|nr:hypothetical protein [Bacillota bacterium]